MIIASQAGAFGRARAASHDATMALLLLVATVALLASCQGGAQWDCFIWCLLDHNDPSKPSYRLTNGPEPSKTIESNGSNIKKPS